MIYYQGRTTKGNIKIETDAKPGFTGGRLRRIKKCNINYTERSIDTVKRAIELTSEWRIVVY